jgi:NADH-quinone oxidoreductase subunit F
VNPVTSASKDSSTKTAPAARRVIICAGTGCVANGAFKVKAALEEAARARGMTVHIDLKPEGQAADGITLTKSGCQGFCAKGPLVTVMPEDTLYTHVKPDDATEIVEAIAKGTTVERLLCADPVTKAHFNGQKEIPFYTRQQRFVLRQCGFIDPEDVHEYMRLGGYASARKAWTEMESEQICKEILDSGLRGRGGAGFPTGRKWDIARKQPGEKKYVICNADEGDPGAFMNRSVMEGNPHSVIEGLMIAARAIGADATLVYVRTEYPLAVARMRKAVAEAEAVGVLGKNVFGTGKTLTCEVMEGAGAFVCGEETAMINSIQGGRGMPSPKPPFPAQSGLWGKPTVINNVETLVHAVRIIKEGAQTFRKIGAATSPGTKTFALTGHVVNTGLIEVPFGTTLREVVFNIGGGVTDEKGKPNPKAFKAVQIGGPSGGCLTTQHLDLPLDFDSLRAAGAMVGSGGLVVMNHKTCMVKIARFFMDFTMRESCGKCVLCREGTRQLAALLDDVIEGRGTAETLALLEKLGKAVSKGSLCGLGKTAPNPVLSTLRQFRAEYEAHVFEKRCPTGQCKALRRPTIDPTKCKGCGMCAKACPAGAIKGEKRQPHVIDEKVCIKCGACAAACKLGAVQGI